MLVKCCGKRRNNENAGLKAGEMLRFAAEQKGGEKLENYSILGVLALVFALLVMLIIQIRNENKDD